MPSRVWLAAAFVIAFGASPAQAGMQTAAGKLLDVHPAETVAALQNSRAYPAPANPTARRRPRLTILAPLRINAHTSPLRTSANPLARPCAD